MGLVEDAPSMRVEYNVEALRAPGDWCWCYIGCTDLDRAADWARRWTGTDRPTPVRRRVVEVTRVYTFHPGPASRQARRHRDDHASRRRVPIRERDVGTLRVMQGLRSLRRSLRTAARTVEPNSSPIPPTASDRDRRLPAVAAPDGRAGRSTIMIKGTWNLAGREVQFVGSEFVSTRTGKLVREVNLMFEGDPAMHYFRQELDALSAKPLTIADVLAIGR